MSLALTPAAYATLDYLLEHASQGMPSMPWDCTPAGRSDDIEQRIAYTDLSKNGLIDGHFTEGRRSPYPSFVKLTLNGNQFARRTLKLRQDGPARTWDCRNALLRWYGDHSKLKSCLEFFASSRSWYYGIQFSERDVTSAAVYLADEGLLARSGSGEGDYYQINSRGQARVDEGGINPAQSVPIGGGIYNAVVIGQNHAPVAVGGAVTQVVRTNVVTSGFEQLAIAMAEVLRRLPDLHLKPEDHETAEDAARDALEEVGKTTPEPKVLRRSIAAIKGVLSAIVVGGIEGTGAVAAKELLELLTGLPLG